MLHVFGYSFIEVVIHQHEAAETLDDSQKVVQFVGQASQEFGVIPLAALDSEIKIGGKSKLHGSGGDGARFESEPPS